MINIYNRVIKNYYYYYYYSLIEVVVFFFCFILFFHQLHVEYFVFCFSRFHPSCFFSAKTKILFIIIIIIKITFDYIFVFFIYILAEKEVLSDLIIASVCCIYIYVYIYVVEWHQTVGEIQMIVYSFMCKEKNRSVLFLLFFSSFFFAL